MLGAEKREELTTEGGLDIVGGFDHIASACQRLAAIGCDVSLFIDPDEAQIDAAKRAGAPTIELHTGAYAEAKPGVPRPTPSTTASARRRYTPYLWAWWSMLVTGCTTTMWKPLRRYPVLMN